MASETSMVPVAVYIGGFFLRICRGNIAQIDLADQHGIGDINDAICHLHLHI